MSNRTYVIIGIACLLVVAGVVVAQVQRARKTVELLKDLGTDDSAIALDTLHELKKRGHAIEGDLVQRLGSDRRKERMRAALLLGEVGTARHSGPALLALLKDEWPPARRAAALSLGALGYDGAVSPLVTMIKDTEEDLDTRSIAVRALSRIALAGTLDAPDRALCTAPLAEILERRLPRTPKEVKALAKARTELAERRAKAVREAAGEIVKEAKKPKEKPEEEPKLAPGELPPQTPPPDKEVELRVDAVLALGLLNAPDGLPPILDSMDEATETAAAVRKAACLALEDLPELPRDDLLRAKMGRALLAALSDGTPEVRMTAARALARHSDFNNAGLDGSINEALQYLTRDLTQYGEPDYWVRAAALTACSSRHLAVEQPKAAADVTDEDVAVPQEKSS